ncbi:cobalamin biosynthesis cobd/cbib [Lucifera butyrica]|uniref:Cobalamin biosynthesis protein CobD n=1 Tax=Lucifera butyrica TaxID=1351585 RepID=A0A498R7C9_9FIRM|nr:adenosylcobinamide-phosphate synthase CbiB [Lucifera butyrica]VBB06830.1 cobalamin biosynthesis cobd/cbib [Lucifera butyrica]
MEQYFLFTAVLLDGLFGDPRSNWHPVVIIGKLISAWEKKLRRTGNSSRQQQFAGAVLVFIVLTVTYGITWLIMYGLNRLHPAAAFFGGALLLSFAISPRSLAEAGREIRGYLAAGDLEQARFKVGWIVGRDTGHLDVAEVTRATVETVAENIVDGIISPLFYAAIGGVPLAFLYRAVNTLDSMVGYKNEKYFYFGKVAARTDDIFNYVPARLTGMLLVITAFFLGYNTKRCLKTIWRDAPKHPSPNSGIAEAAVAGALGVRLGGLNYYGGVASLRAPMGDKLTELEPGHIEQTVRMMYMTTALFLALTVLGSYWLRHI